MHAAEPIPVSPQDLSARFLSRVLRGEVTARSVERIGEDQGFTGGGLFRVALRHAPGAQRGPASVVAKFSPADAAMRATFAAANRREIEFYLAHSRRSGLPVADCHYAGFDPDSGASLLLIEDLGALRGVGFVDACTPADAARVVDALARVHATFWDAPLLAPLSGADILREFAFRDAWALYPERLGALWPGFAIPDGFRHLAGFVARHDTAIFSYLMNRGPLTLIHRDAHVENVLFDDRDGARPAVLLDWQIMGKGKGVCDLAYFLISSLEPGCRRDIEAPMLARYHAALLRQGVRGYDMAQCRRDFLAAVVGKLFVTVVATALLDNSTPHKTLYRRTDLTRLLAFCEDHAISAETLRFMLD